MKILLALVIGIDISHILVADTTFWLIESKMHTNNTPALTI